MLLLEAVTLPSSLTDRLPIFSRAMIEFAIPETVTLPLSFSNLLPYYILGDDVLSRHLFLLFFHDTLSRHLVLIDFCTIIDYIYLCNRSDRDRVRDRT